MSKPGSRSSSVADALKSVVSSKKDKKNQSDPEPGSLAKDQNQPEQLEQKEQKESPPCCAGVSKFVLRVAYSIICAVTLLIGLATLLSTVFELGTLNLFQGPKSSLVAAYALNIFELIAIVVLIVAGVGIWLQNRKVLFGAAALLVVLAVVQVITLAVSEQNYTKNAEKYLSDLFQESRNNNKNATKEYSNLESAVKCCGYNSFQDYPKVITPYHTEIYLVSPGCCPGYNASDSKLVQKTKQSLCINRENFYRKGCAAEAKKAAEKFSGFVVALVVIFVVLELLVAALAVPNYCKKDLPPSPNPAPHK